MEFWILIHSHIGVQGLDCGMRWCQCHRFPLVRELIQKYSNALDRCYGPIPIKCHLPLNTTIRQVCLNMVCSSHTYILKSAQRRGLGIHRKDAPQGSPSIIYCKGQKSRSGVCYSTLCTTSYWKPISQLWYSCTHCAVYCKGQPGAENIEVCLPGAAK